MSSLDYILLTPVLFGLLRGLMRGLVKELLSLVSIVAGVLAAKFCSAPVANVLHTSLSIPAVWANWIAYVVMFFAVAALCTLLRKIIMRFINNLDLGGFNRLLGAAFGALKWALVVSVCLNLLAMVEDKIPIIKPEEKQASVTYKPLFTLASTAWTYVKSEQSLAGEEQPNEEHCTNEN